MSKNRISRRQFLNYTLTGVGGFMAAGMLMPMVRFAVDPVLKHTGTSDFRATPQKISEITEVPTRVDFAFKQKDAWYESEVTNSAWVYKNTNGEIVALSPVCKHLGCTIDWNTNKKPGKPLLLSLPWGSLYEGWNQCKRYATRFTFRCVSFPRKRWLPLFR